MKPKLADALGALLPDTEWTFYGNDLNTLIIHTPNITAPTQSEIDDWLAAHP